MNTLIATRTRRLSWAFLSLVLAFGLTCFLTWLGARNGAPLPARGQLLIRFFAFPPVLAIVVLAFLTSACKSVPVDPVGVGTAPSNAVAAPPFQAQVVGLQWLNPLQRLDYPTEWQLLWTLGLARPNKNDEYLSREPKKYSTVQMISGIADGNHEQASFERYHEQYLDRLLMVFGDNYFSDPDYFYNAHRSSEEGWRELAGIHMEYALPADGFDPVAAADSTAKRIAGIFDVVNTDFPDLRSRTTPPDVRVTLGGANAGFVSLSAALDYLQAHPSETVWVMNWDAPSRPKDAQINENLVVLFLAGPAYDTAREPLAWVGYPATKPFSDFEIRKGLPSRWVQAWMATLAAAAHNANKQGGDVGFVIHDGSNEAAPAAASALSGRFGNLMEALSRELPEFDVVKQTFDTPLLLGEMGAGTALTNVALAIGYANHLGKNVLVAGTTDTSQPTAVMIVPPDKVRPIDPSQDWFRALRTEDIYLPWWGLRRDGPRQSQIQGYSD